MINNKLISPVIYVASYSNNKNAQETEDYYTKKTIYSSYRSFEYVEGSTVDPPNADLEARFKNHMPSYRMRGQNPLKANFVLPAHLQEATASCFLRGLKNRIHEISFSCKTPQTSTPMQ